MKNCETQSLKSFDSSSKLPSKMKISSSSSASRGNSYTVENQARNAL